MLGQKPISLFQQCDAFDRISDLANVSLPILRQQSLLRMRIGFARAAFSGACELIQESLHQGNDVIPSFAKGRNVDRRDIQSVE